MQENNALANRMGARRPGNKPFRQIEPAPKLWKGLSAKVVAVSISAAQALAVGRPGDAALARAISDLRLPPKEGRRAFDLTQAIYRHWARLAWLWERVGGAVSGRSIVLAGLRTLEGADASRIAPLLRENDNVPSLTPVEAMYVERLRVDALTQSQFPQEVSLECPRNLFPFLQRSFGADFEPEMRALQASPDVCLRANTLKITAVEAIAALAKVGIQAHPGALIDTALYVPRAANISETELFRNGAVEIQDEGSQAIAALLGATQEMQVLDLCAGAGGKSLALGAIMKNKGHLVAADVHAARLARAKLRLKRGGVENAECRQIDSDWLKSKRGRFERILIDAPCSGTGSWARNPDQRWTWRPEALARLMLEQDKLLEQAARLVRPGGKILFATCSLLQDEGEARIAAFLKRAPAFRMTPLADNWSPPLLGKAPDSLGDWLRLSPAKHGVDGFFAAILERSALAHGQD
jgi:16S rRNA (cytosine967-C5)-methyltransferase